MADINTYVHRRHGWEKRMEDLIIDIMEEKTEKGLLLLINTGPLVDEFLSVLRSVDKARVSDKCVLVAPIGGYPENND